MSVFTKPDNNKPSRGRSSGRDYCVVVPILNPNMAEGLVKMAAALAGARLEGERRHIRIVVVGIVTVPDDTPLSQGASLVRAYRTMLRYIPQNTEADEDLEIQTEVRVAREVWRGIVDQVLEEKGDLLLLHWKGNTHSSGKIYGDTIDALMANPPCDIVLGRFNVLPEIKNILLPVRGGSYSNLALSLASNLAEQWNANITVLHTLERSSTTPLNPLRGSGLEQDYKAGAAEVEEERLNALQNLLLELPPSSRLLTLQENTLNGIVREAQSQDLIILGASEVKDRKDERQLNAKLAENIAAQTSCPVLVVKTRQPFTLLRPALGASVKPALPYHEPNLDELVDRWFAQNTFHYREFRSMSSLTILKERNNLSVSLVLPVYGKIQPVALAEIVRRARFALMRDCALVDEIIVAAPDNRLDATEIAAFYDSGTFFDAAEKDDIIYLAPDATRPGPVQPSEAENDSGPGESMWYAMRQVRGDIVVWADPTLAGFEARLIYGLVGPLLSYPEFQLSSGFYSQQDTADPAQSVPVVNTLVELSVRPLLGGFFPPLAGVVNPLCSVGAARRDLLERMPFFTGPAFMTGLLVDTFVRSGLMSIAQIDLGTQPAFHGLNIAPQRVTADVLSVILHRAEERSQSSLLAGFDPSVKTIHKSEGVYSLQVKSPVSVPRELPPVAFTSGYHRRTFEAPPEHQ